jgi:hypothetical protein
MQLPAMKTDMQTFQKWMPCWLMALSYALYAICLALPAYLPISSYMTPERYFGYAAFLLGPIGLFAGHVSWFANPMIWISWINFRKGNNRGAIAAAVLAVGIALTFLMTKKIAVGSSGEYPFEILYGYYVWIGSMLAAAAAALIGGLAQHDEQHQAQ